MLFLIQNKYMLDIVRKLTIMMKESIIFFYSKNNSVFLAMHSRKTMALKVNK